MTSRQTKVLVWLTLYLLTMAGLTIYHAFNFSDYVHYKGDETINYILFLLFTSMLFQGLIWVVTSVFDWKAAAIATIGNFIFSFIMGFVIWEASGLSGIPRHLIFLYGGCYLTFFALVTVLQSRRIRTKTE